ncbi:hypothetical protein QJS04_geneDACA000773 [Acorus gramineus]|uniref:4a-hydroxytetrahydrobiopterin dehydratase n=1 Tax=Acorus gramineus TaxID=55184 RepID=A0AAV9BEB4_ACOGR|nr:hypothetical protein QJS04_geneDACA000773 [Acorus gramineus]
MLRSGTLFRWGSIVVLRRHSALRHHHPPIRLPFMSQQLSGIPSYSSSSEASSAAMDDLAMKKCVPCSSKDIKLMTEESANELMTKVEGWNLESENGIMKLQRAWKMKSFTKGLEFFQLIADVAEREGHHPDLHLAGWNNVRIDIWTHSVGGLTENDFILAAKINILDIEHLVRKKSAA